MTTNTVNAEQVILDSMKAVMNDYGSLRETLHKNVLIPTVIYAWKNQDQTIISKVLNLGLLSKEFRIESVAYWFSELAGFKVDYNPAKNSFKASLSTSNSSETLGINYTRDTNHLNTLKLEKYRFWNIAPVKISLLKVETQLDKVFSNVEKTIAKGLALNEYSIQDVKDYLEAKLIPNAVTLKTDEKVKKWVSDYLDQQLAIEVKETA